MLALRADGDEIMSDEVHWTEEFWESVNILAEDGRKCIAALDQTDETDLEAKYFWRRMLAHATFALINDIAFRFLFSGYASYKAKVPNISQEEFEKFYDLRADEVKAEGGRATFPEALEFGFRAFKKGFDSDYVVPAPGVEWEAIEQLEELRERMEMPNTPAGIELTEEDVQIMLKAVRWILANTDQLMDSTPLDAVFRARKNDPSTS